MTSRLEIQDTCTAPVVALHSSASNSSQWNSLIADLGERYEVTAFDLPGYGDELERDYASTDMEALARPVLDKILDFGEPVHLVGHSCGGGVALKIAMMRPDVIRSLTLYEPAAFNLLETGRHSDQMLLRDLEFVEEALNRSIDQGAAHRGMRVFIDFWNGDGAWDRMPDAVLLKLVSLAPTVAKDFKNVFAEDWTANDLSNLTMPVLLMMGMDSPTVAQRTIALLVERSPNVELAMLPGLGHMAPIFAPQWVNPRIVQHIARIERSASRFGWPQDVAA